MEKRPQLVRGLFEPGIVGLILIIAGMVASLFVSSKPPAAVAIALVVAWALLINCRSRARP
jgi:uncharacterized membrane protein